VAAAVTANFLSCPPPQQQRQRHTEALGKEERERDGEREGEGIGGWAALHSWARPPPLTTFPSSRDCPGCACNRGRGRGRGRDLRVMRAGRSLLLDRGPAVAIAVAVVVAPCVGREDPLRGTGPPHVKEGWKTFV